MSQSLRSNGEISDDPDPGMSLSRADQDAVCATCSAGVVTARSYCRLYLKNEATLLCSPWCALRYFNRMHAAANGWNRLDLQKQEFAKLI
jgi:hypothetical protein